MKKHVVWDWNGTLLDDTPVVVQAASASLAAFGVAPLTVDAYRRAQNGSARSFYGALLGREIGDDDWLRLDEPFQHLYATRLGSCQLASDARAALGAVAAAGWSQSLLSMSYESQLRPIVTGRGVAGYFARIDGQRGIGAITKTLALQEHLAALALEPSRAVLIGDSLDDLASARAVGADIVLYSGGCTHPDNLAASGAPVAATLLDALALAGLPGAHAGVRSDTSGTSGGAALSECWQPSPS